MQALLCQTFGPPESLRIQDVPDPTPQPHEVILRVITCSANFPDVLIIQNQYQFKPNLPFSPGGEVAGIIEAVGEQVTRWKKGQRVIALCGWGGMAEKVAVSQDKVIPLPDTMDYISGASLLYTFGTTLHALQDRAKILPGETLLILGAGGGIGLAAIQVGKWMGAQVFAVASTPEKRQVCLDMGADFVLPYDPAEWKKAIGPQGVNVILDPVGGKWSEPAVRMLSWQGRYLVVGFTDGSIGQPPLNLALLKGGTWMGVFWGRFTQEQPLQNQQNSETLARLFEEKKIKSHIHKIYSLEEASQALTDLQNRQVIGKAIVLVDPVVGQESPAVAVSHPAPLLFDSLQALDQHEGKSLGTTPWLTITQDLVNDFARTTGDYQWIHLDANQAAQTPFQKTIVHGFLTLSLMSQWMYQLYRIEGSTMAVNSGSNRVRYLHPIPVGSRLRAHAVLEKVEKRNASSRRLTTLVSIEMAGYDKPVCTAELLSIVYE